jgi:hypothetical protein
MLDFKFMSKRFVSMDSLEPLIPNLEKVRAQVEERVQQIEVEEEFLSTEKKRLRDQLIHICALLDTNQNKLDISITATESSLAKSGGEEERMKPAGNREMKRPPLLSKFAGMSPINAIARVLQSNPDKEFNSDELLPLLFGNLDQEASEHARRHTIAELSRGARAGKWRSTRRGAYASNPSSFNQDNQAPQNQSDEVSSE